MAKRYLTIDTFNGGLVTNSDPANLGGVASKVLKNFRIDKHGTLVSRKRRDHIKSIDRGIVYIHNFIDVTNNDNNVWFAIGSNKKVYMYNDSWGDESNITTNPIHTFTGTIDKYAVHDDGNVVRISPGTGSDAISIQYITSRQFFYGYKTNWYNLDTANSGWWVDTARPIRTTDLPFRLHRVSIVPDVNHRSADPGASNNTDGIYVYKNKLVGNIRNTGGQYKYRIVPVFDGDQEAPIEFDSNVVGGVNDVVAVDRHNTKATMDRKTSTYSEENDYPLEGKFDPSSSPTGSTVQVRLQDIALTTKKKSKDQVNSITITSPGNYGTDADPPSVTISGGGGSGATATATLTLGAVTGVTMTNNGTGYTSTPTVTFGDAPVGQPKAEGTAVVGVRGPYVTNSKWNPRITRLNVYRANINPVDFTTKPSYRLIDTVPINTDSSDRNGVTADIHTLDPHQFIVRDKNIETTQYFAFLFENYKEEDCEISYKSINTAREDQPYNHVHEIDVNNDFHRTANDTTGQGMFKHITSSNVSTDGWIPDIFNGRWETYDSTDGKDRSEIRDSGSGLYGGVNIIIVKSLGGTAITSGVNYDGELDNCIIEYENGGATYHDVITNSHVLKNNHYTSSVSEIQNHALYQEYYMVCRVAGNSFPSKKKDTGNYTIFKNNFPMYVNNLAVTISDPSGIGDSNTGDDKVSLTYYDTGRSQNRSHPFQNQNNNVKYEVQHIYGNRNWVGDVKITALDGEVEEHSNALMYSELSQYDNIPTTNFIKLIDVQGGKIMGINSLMNNLVVFGEKGIFRVNIPRSDPGSYSIKETLKNVKVVSKYGIANSEDSIFFCSDKNVFELTPNFTLKDISHPIRNIYRKYSTSDHSESMLVYDPAERKLLMKLGKMGSVYVMEYEGGVPVWTETNAIARTSFMTMSKDNKKTFIDSRRSTEYSAQYNLSTE